LSGAVVAPQAIVMKTAAISGPFGSTIATRSLRPMPIALSASTVRPANARNPPWLKETRPGAAIAGASAAPLSSMRMTVSAG
jgi:hypothetical protein